MPKQESVLQIDRDLNRTFPKNPFFSTVGDRGQRKLRKVLRAFSCYDNQADYVQGMNFLVGQLLMHCTDGLAFWLFVELIEECELRDIYQVGLPGLQKHSIIIKMLVKKHLPDLSDHFDEHQVQTEMYASDWIFSLFCSVLPENQSSITSSFFTQFFEHKWEFFYKLVLSLLEHIQPKLLAAEDMFSILQQIKIAMSNKNDPYNYALVYQQSQLQGEQKLINNDSDMVDILGSIHVNDTEHSNEMKKEMQPEEGLLSRVSKYLKFGKQDEPEKWQEFPWEQIMIKTNVIKKWEAVDMKQIYNMHANFDIESGRFLNMNIDEVLNS